MSTKSDIGIVTPGGIWFNGKIYSCSLAIKQQWFRLSEQIRGWPVSIQFDEKVPDEINVMLQDGNVVQCIRIDHIPIDPSKLCKYYLEFQLLADLRRKQQKQASPTIEV